LKIINLTKRIDKKKDKNGKCSKKLRQLFGKRVQLIIIKNGIILYKIHSKRFNRSQFCQRTILTLELYKWISRKERKKEQKIQKKQRI
jgi:hypothetical protein